MCPGNNDMVHGDNCLTETDSLNYNTIFLDKLTSTPYLLLQLQPLHTGPAGQQPVFLLLQGRNLRHSSIFNGKFLKTQLVLVVGGWCFTRIKNCNDCFAL